MPRPSWTAPKAVGHQIKGNDPPTIICCCGPYLECSAHLFGPQRTSWSKSRGESEDYQRSGAPLLEAKLRKLGMFNLERRRLQEDFIAASQYLKCTYKKPGGGLSTRACSDRTRKLRNISQSSHRLQKNYMWFCIWLEKSFINFQTML